MKYLIAVLVGMVIMAGAFRADALRHPDQAAIYIRVCGRVDRVLFVRQGGLIEYVLVPDDELEESRILRRVSRIPDERKSILTSTCPKAPMRGAVE